MKAANVMGVMGLAMVTATTLLAAEPAAEEQEKEAQRAAEIRMTVQAICPVSGQKLGGHGKPVAVKIGEEEVYLCCKGCAKGKVDAKHWATIHANFAKAQGICPVMGHALPKDAKWTIVHGRIVYVCCPPCIKKIEAGPDPYLKKVDELYAASLEKKEKDKKSKESEE